MDAGVRAHHLRQKIHKGQKAGSQSRDVGAFRGSAAVLYGDEASDGRLRLRRHRFASCQNDRSALYADFGHAPCNRKRQRTVFKRQVLRFCRRQTGDFPACRMGDNSPPKYPRTFETSALHHLLLPDGKRGAQPFGAFRRRAKTSRRQRAFVHDILPADNPRDSFNFVTTKQKAAFCEISQGILLKQETESKN